MKLKVNKRFLYTLLSAGVILLGTAVAIHYAKGNFRMTENGFVQGTGLLAANSFPTAAEVLINNKLVTVTDDTIYLEPDEYDIEIVKDGYNSWKKRVVIEKELVVQTNATLFPIAPSLTNLTYNGAANISPSPDGQKIIFYAHSNTSERKNGLYLFELSNNTFFVQNEPRQITNEFNEFDLKTAQFIWSPDSSEVILISDTREVLLDITKLNTLEALPDISFRKKQILSEWEQEMYLRERSNFTNFPPEIVSIATSSAQNVYISPDKKRMLYTASQAVTIPADLIKEVPASSTQPEQRTLTVGDIYVYDSEEDRNFKVGTTLGEGGTDALSAPGKTDAKTNESDLNERTKKTHKLLLALDLLDKNSPLITASPSAFTSLQATTSAQTAQNFTSYYSSTFTTTPQWFPDSKHLLYIENNSIKIMEYDATNQTTLYSGPFADTFVYPWPNGDRLIILTSFSPDAPQNLYALELKK